MAWQKVGGSSGPIFKWDTPGKALEGVYLGLRSGKEFSGKKSKLARIQTTAGEVSAGAPTALAGRLEEVPVGALVRITYKGMTRGQAGVEYKDFDVDMDVSAVPSSPADLFNARQPFAPTPEQRLVAAVGKPAADLMFNALEIKYPNAVDRAKALDELLAARGIA